MDAPPRAHIFLLLAVLAITAVLYSGAPRRFSWLPFVTGSLPHTDLPGTSSILYPGAGPLSIPNAALEPVGWGDLDGWTSDDHAIAFATFNASCRAIARAAAFRAESAINHAAAPQPVRTALEQVCFRAIKAGGLKSEAARQFFETNFVPVRIRRLGDSAGFVTGYTNLHGP
jgi:MltA specific insert domain